MQFYAPPVAFWVQIFSTALCYQIYSNFSNIHPIVVYHIKLVSTCIYW